MSKITRVDESDGSRTVKVGEHILAVFTPQTEEFAVKRFIELAQQIEDKLIHIGEVYERAVETNFRARSKGEKGRNYPIFIERERLVNKLCKDAGVVDD